MVNLSFRSFCSCLKASDDWKPPPLRAVAPSGPYLGSTMKSTAVRTFLAAASLRLFCLTVNLSFRSFRSFRSCSKASDD